MTEVEETTSPEGANPGGDTNGGGENGGGENGGGENGGGENGGGDNGGDKPVWIKRFALGVFVAVAIVTFSLVGGTSVLEPDLGIAVGSDGRQVLAARVVGIVAAVGIAVVATGVWMALVEWRGRFAAVERAQETVRKAVTEPGGSGVTGFNTAEAAQVVPETVKAVGALRGAALVLVSGAVILLGVSWMTASATSAPPATTSTTAPPVATTTTAPPGGSDGAS